MLFILKMSNDLFNISLNQGKKFMEYQKVIKKQVIKKEGFQSGKNIPTDIPTDLSVIISKLSQLDNTDNIIHNELNINAEKINDSLKTYKLTNAKIKQELDIEENMQNMNDLNGMLTDTDLRVLQENYYYIAWSILAVGILTVTINTMRK